MHPVEHETQRCQFAFHAFWLEAVSLVWTFDACSAPLFSYSTSSDEVSGVGNMERERER